MIQSRAFRSIALIILIVAFLVLGNLIRPKKLKSYSVVLVENRWAQQARIVGGERMDDPEGVFLMFTADGTMVHQVDEAGETNVVSQKLYRVRWNGHDGTIETATNEDWNPLTVGKIQLDGDTLVICFAKEGQPAPTHFSTDNVEGGGEIMFEYRRR